MPKKATLARRPPCAEATPFEGFLRAVGSQTGQSEDPAPAFLPVGSIIFSTAETGKGRRERNAPFPASDWKTSVGTGVTYGEGVRFSESALAISSRISSITPVKSSVDRSSSETGGEGRFSSGRGGKGFMPQ